MNILLAYDFNYQEYARYCINSILAHNPEATIYAIVKKDVNKYIEGIHYIILDPKLYNCCFRGCRIQSDVVYNYLYAPQLVKAPRVIVFGVDNISNGDLSPIYNHEVSEHGIAAFEPEKKKLQTLKDFVYYFSDGYTGDYNPAAPSFNNGGMVMDLDIMREKKAYERFMEYVQKWRMSEMLAKNLYCNGDWVKMDNKYLCHANYEKKDDALIMDFHGRKPWNEATPYRELWRQYG